MRHYPLLLAAVFGTLVYVVVSLTGGHDGLLAEKQLAQQKRVMSIHTAEIQQLNTDLSLEFTALQKDPDVMAACARRLGYVKQDEKLVKITGLPAAPVMQYNTGAVLKRHGIFFLPEWMCKVFGLTVFILSLIIILLFDYRHGIIGKKNRKYETLKGIPVYDVPQI